jgi:hypothetical protein
VSVSLLVIEPETEPLASTAFGTLRDGLFKAVDLRLVGRLGLCGNCAPVPTLSRKTERWQKSSFPPVAAFQAPSSWGGGLGMP